MIYRRDGLCPSFSTPQCDSRHSCGRAELGHTGLHLQRAALGSGLTLLLADHCPLLLLPVRDVSPQGSPSDLRLPGLWL